MWLSGKNLKTVQPSKKLDNKYYRFFKILQKIGKQAYRLWLPPTMKIHPVFHVSLLESFHSANYKNSQPPPIIVDNKEE